MAENTSASECEAVCLLTHLCVFLFRHHDVCRARYPMWARQLYRCIESLLLLLVVCEALCLLVCPLL